MLQPLYDRYCNHIAYLDSNRYLFDTDLKWIAFVDNRQVFSLDLQWIGPINGAICMDKDGKVVAWGLGQKLMGDPSVHRKPKYAPRLPEAPVTFLRPMTQSPPIPATPLVGWSNLSFADWVKG
jgi:hypothetical protein